jgi:hypothetical protein
MYKCKYCCKECKSTRSISAHECVCPENNNRKIFSRTWSAEKKKAWSEKCKITGCNNTEWTPEQRAKQKERTISFNNTYWTAEQKLIHSAKMIDIVKTNPDSYSKNNVSGRVKMYEINSTKVKGTWELRVAQWLNNHNILWTNSIKPYNYFWKDKWHLYFPDFLLIDTNILIEVKGYETARDTAKWATVNDRELIIIRKKEINNLDNILQQAAGKQSGQVS